VKPEPFTTTHEAGDAAREPGFGPTSGTFPIDELRAVLEALPIAVFVMGPDGQPHYCNHFARRMAGGKHATATLKQLAEQNKVRRRSTGRPMTWPEFPIVRALRGEFTVDHDIEVTFPERTIALGVYAGPLEDDHGQVRYALAAFADLTKQDIWDRSQEELEQRYRRVVEQVPDAVLIIHCDGHVLEANAAAGRSLGYAPDELPGVAIGQIMDGITAEQVAELVMKASLEVCTPLRLQLIRRDQSRCPAEAQLSALTVAGDPALLISARDLTERLRMEQDMRQAHRFEAVGQLAAGVAHEINTPMQYIGDNTTFLRTTVERLLGVTQSFEELLLACESGSVTMDQVQQCKKSLTAARVPFLKKQAPIAIEQSLQGIAHVSSIIQGLKEFSHPGGEEKVTVDLNHVARTAATVTRNEWRYHSTLDLSLKDGLPVILGHPQELGQMMINLIVNAAHAIESRHGQAEGPTQGHIVIRTEEINGFVELSIADNGSGIPDAIRHRVMDPFFTTKEVGKGTGQGLALAHNVVVEKHRGQLFFESEVGQGTTFFVRLPLPNDG
jgi:PAS domain S-box-containing protein